MGWNEVWKTANDWGHLAWTESVKLSYTLNTISIPEVVKGTAEFTFNTFIALTEEVAALPHMLKSVAFHPKSRRTFGHLARIGVEDFGSLIVASQLKNHVDYWLVSALQGSEAAPWLSASTLLWSSLMLVRAVHAAYDFRKRVQIGIRLTMVTIEASGTMTSSNPELDSMGKLCEKESKLSAILGSLSDLIKYTMTDFTIKGVKKIPVVGPVSGSILATKHTGDYILTAVLKGMCPDHVRTYLQQHASTAWVLGMTHTGITLYVNQSLEWHTGIPREWYTTITNQTVLVALIAVAAHMRLPPPVAQSNRNQPDPIRFYKAGLQVGLNVLGYGLKAEIPEMLKNKSVMPWDTVFSVVSTVWYHSSMQTAKTIFLPPMLHGKRAFYRDPVVEPNWESLRSRVITAILLIEKYQQKLLVATAAKIPRISAKIAALLGGAPKPVVTLVLRLMGNEQFMKNLAAFRRRLESMHIVDMPENANLREVHHLNVDMPRGKEPTVPNTPRSETIPVSPAELLKIPSNQSSPLLQRVLAKAGPSEDGCSAALIISQVGLFATSKPNPATNFDAYLDPGALFNSASQGPSRSNGKDPLG